MNETLKTLALDLFDIGAVQFGSFTLRHHQENPSAPPSPILFNLRTPDNPKPGPLTPELVGRIGQAMYDVAAANGLYFNCVAGIPNAGRPLAQALHEACPKTDDPPILLELVKADAAGMSVATDRFIQAGAPTVDSKPLLFARLLLVDDVLTKADSKIKAIAFIESLGGITADVVVLIDRQQGGSETLWDAGFRVWPVFTMEELLRLYVDHQRIDPSEADRVLRYVAASQLTHS